MTKQQRLVIDNVLAFADTSESIYRGSATKIAGIAVGAVVGTAGVIAALGAASRPASGSTSTVISHTNTRGPVEARMFDEQLLDTRASELFDEQVTFFETKPVSQAHEYDLSKLDEKYGKFKTIFHDIERDAHRLFRIKRVRWAVLTYWEVYDQNMSPIFGFLSFVYAKPHEFALACEKVVDFYRLFRKNEMFKKVHNYAFEKYQALRIVMLNVLPRCFLSYEFPGDWKYGKSKLNSIQDPLCVFFLEKYPIHSSDKDKVVFVWSIMLQLLECLQRKNINGLNWVSLRQTQEFADCQTAVCELKQTTLERQAKSIGAYLNKFTR